MKLSTATSVFVNYSIEAAVDQVIAAGFDGIDLWCGRPHLFRKDYPEAHLIQLRQKMQRSGLSVAAVMPAFFRYPFSLSSPIEAIRNDSIAYMKDCIDNAVLMGAPHVLVVPSNPLFGQTVEEAGALFTGSMADILGHAETRGVKLGIEVLNPNLSRYLGFTEQALGVLRDLQSDSMGIVLDTGHLNLSGERFAAAVDRAGDRLLQVHVNDNNGREQQNAVPGDGTFPFAEMVETLRQHNYQGYLTLELGWHYSFDPASTVHESVKRLKAYLEAPGADREGGRGEHRHDP